MGNEKPEWLVRLGAERDELSAKMYKLHEYIFRNKAFYALNTTRQMFLRQQYQAMEQYRLILDMRLEYEVSHDQ